MSSTPTQESKSELYLANEQATVSYPCVYDSLISLNLIDLSTIFNFL
jgi:hypothetical protein